MDIRPLPLPGVFEIIPPRFEDARGYFTESWNRETLARAGFDLDFIQDNQSFTRIAGTVRGLHYQAPPKAQDKLIRATRGRVFDVVVDVRPGSSHFRRWSAVVLDAALGNQILVPQGFAHGFQTLEPDCEVQYKVTAPYAPDLDRAIRWDDPALAIAWPLPVDADQLSPKDAAAPHLAAQDTGF
ncbi:MAG: dTDP-4-dehydrorhamnose 3,5-epimerase [Pseudomonadota bacterium]|jgi:dTDP-4-dehydrorhamnose 3,5-epimerase